MGFVLCLLPMCGLSQTAGPAAQSAPASQPAATVTPSRPPQSPAAELPPDAVVIAIHGYCPSGGSAQDGPTKPDACATNITKEQFSKMIAAMSFNPQMLNNPVAVRSFAESYVEALALADAAEKSGFDKDPQFEELMRIIRVRTLADSYRRHLQQEYRNAPGDQVEAYYKQNPQKYEQVELDRIAIPKINPKLDKAAQAEWNKKAEKFAVEIHDRAANGEDPVKLQAEAYKAIGLTPPLTTDLGTRRRGSLPTAAEQEIFSLKAGEVTKLQSDAAAFTIYKVRSHSTIPLESAKEQISQEIQQKSLQAATHEVTGKLHADFNDQFFGGRTAPRVPSATH
jgi:hypothetical protein